MNEKTKARKIADQGAEKKAEELLKNPSKTMLEPPPSAMPEGYRANAQEVIKYRTANNINRDNKIFFKAMSETGGTCTFIYYLYLKYKEKDVQERDIAPKINLDVLKMLDKRAPANPFKASTNPVGRVSRTLAEVRKLVRMNGELEEAETVRKLIPEAYLNVVQNEIIDSKDPNPIRRKAGDSGAPSKINYPEL